MKHYKLIYFLCSLIAITSCVEDEQEIVESIKGSPNVIGFVERASNVTEIADGTQTVFDMPVSLKGPTARNTEGTFTASISVDPSSTAIEGVHFRLDQTSFEVTSDGNWINTVPVTMLTDGVNAPLNENPLLVLNVTDADGPGNLVANGSALEITMLYLCPTFLNNTYTVTITRSDGTVYEYTDVIASTGKGQYRGRSVGHWAPGTIGGAPGFDFLDVCNKIIVPDQNLVDLYSNIVSQTDSQEAASVVDPTTGNLHIEYRIELGDGYSDYKADYVKN